VEGEVVGSNSIGCVHNLPKKKKIKGVWGGGEGGEGGGGGGGCSSLNYFIQVSLGLTNVFIMLSFLCQ
jgi:hypothetical protein